MSAESLVVVGVGASAGGLEAIERFFAEVSASPHVTYVIVQHLSPDHKSLMGELLARHTRLPIYVVTDGIQVEPASIYLMPKKSNLSYYDGRLFLSEPEPGLNLPIDIFFRSLAEACEERAVGVVLSGTGSDGTRGIRAIKEAGGLVFVQDESTAKFDGMPASAIRTGIVDHVLPPEEMPERIARFAEATQLGRSLEPEAVLATSSTVARILMLVKKRTGVDLSSYKQSTIYRRIERRIGIRQCSSVEAYLEILRTEPEEVTTFFKEVLIGVTKFFRDPEAFEELRSRVIPEIVGRADRRGAIRVWVPACSTGEEAYSLAILFAEHMRRNDLAIDVRIFATDIDRDALQFASAGVYPESIAADADHERLQHFFVHRGESYQIAPEIREMVIFAYHNVFQDPPFRRIDLISCRNLLIYLQPNLQQKVLSNFAFSLDVGGFLFLGSSETIGEFTRYFDSFDIRWKLFRSSARRPSRGDDVDYTPSTFHDLGQPPPAFARRRPSDPDMEQVYASLLDDLVSPAVIVTEDRIVERVFGDVSPFLKLPAGKIDLSLTRLARDAISIPLGNAIQAAVDDSRPVRTSAIAVDVGGEVRPVTIEVTPARAEHGYLYLVSFSVGTEATTDVIVADFNVDEGVRRRVRNLENELQHTQENLQATIEELETANEELQATNEELLSSNEELQSTNEELQSVNEELITVNSEYQKKIEELSELNDDMDNLLKATPVGTIFLDRTYAIRRYTPAVTALFRIIPGDIGRPIGDLSHSLDYPDLLSDIRRVGAGEGMMEREVRDAEGRWHLARILPYSEDGDRTSGVVVAFIDITRRTLAEASGIRQNTLLMRVLDTNPTAMLMVDREGRVIYANDAAHEMLGEELPRIDLPFEKVRATRDAHVGLQAGTFTVNGTPMFDETGDVDGAIFSILDARHEQ